MKLKDLHGQVIMVIKFLKSLLGPYLTVLKRLPRVGSLINTRIAFLMSTFGIFENLHVFAFR